jgi:hypothetical protein
MASNRFCAARLTRIVATLACLALLSAAALAAAEVAQNGTLRLTVSGSLSPRRLPRTGTAPIAVSVAWKVATTDGSSPPKLKRLRIAINRNGRFDYAGMPLCKLTRIQPGSSVHALSACRPALVGRGRFTASIALQGQAPYDTRGRLLVFNGRLTTCASRNAGATRNQRQAHARTRRGGHAPLIQDLPLPNPHSQSDSFWGLGNGPLARANAPHPKRSCHSRPVLLGHIYSARPFANSFVIVFALNKLAHGPYGTVLNATLPRALSAWGNLTGIEMTLSRRFSFRGRTRSYISAGCPTPKGVGIASFNLARTTFNFADGRALATTVNARCRARG